MFGAVPPSTHFRPRAPSSAREVHHSPNSTLGHSAKYYRVEMEAHVPSLDQLRNNAAECIRLAEGARTSAHKSFFIEMADRWLTLAERAEKTHDR
jgi:anaerobic glycerol-3-phosphate dehydrogenase